MVEVKAINNIQLLSRSYCQQQAIIIAFAKVVFSAGQGDYSGKQHGLSLFKVSELLKEQTNPGGAEVINRGLLADLALRSATDGRRSPSSFPSKDCAPGLEDKKETASVKQGSAGKMGLYTAHTGGGPEGEGWGRERQLRCSW